MMDEKEVAIIGMGPGGVSAAIYLKRYGMKPVCFEKELIGGKVNKTEKIENYPGVKEIQGPVFGNLLEEQLSSFDIQPIYKEVKKLSLNEDSTFHIEYGKHFSSDFRYVILANGLAEKPFVIPGEEKFQKKGISRCAICDGPFYKGKDVAVIGGGNAAFEEAIYLSNICHHVSLIARRNVFRAQESVVEKFKGQKNTSLYAPYDVLSCDGKDSISVLQIQNKESMEKVDLSIQGLFLYVGEIPSTGFVDLPMLESENGYIKTDSSLETNIQNLFAIGDCRNTPLRQVSTAVGDGALAASMIHLKSQRG